MTTTIELTEEQQLALDFEQCPTIRGRIVIKRRAFKLGYMTLVGEMLTKLVPPSDVLRDNQTEI
jgi:hypothetical protein